MHAVCGSDRYTRLGSNLDVSGYHLLPALVELKQMLPQVILARECPIRQRAIRTRNELVREKPSIREVRALERRPDCLAYILFRERSVFAEGWIDGCKFSRKCLSHLQTPAVASQSSHPSSTRPTSDTCGTCTNAASSDPSARMSDQAEIDPHTQRTRARESVFRLGFPDRKTRIEVRMLRSSRQEGIRLAR